MQTAAQHLSGMHVVLGSISVTERTKLTKNNQKMNSHREKQVSYCPYTHHEKALLKPEELKAMGTEASTMFKLPLQECAEVITQTKQQK